MTPATCRKCPAVLPPRKGTRGGRSREVCDDCQRTKARESARRVRERRAAGGVIQPRTPKREDLGPEEPLLGGFAAEAEERRKMEARLVRAALDGVPLRDLEERHSGARWILERHGVAAVWDTQLPYGSAA